MIAFAHELWFNVRMEKKRALDLLGGTVSAAAEAIGISYQAVEKWPDPLPRRIEDRVIAAVARRLLPHHLIGTDGAPAIPQEVAHG